MFFRAIGFAIRYGGVIVTAVSLVEGLVSRDTSGETKRKLVTETVIEILSSFGIRTTAETREMIGEIADIAVLLLNRLGIFQHAVDRPDEEEFAPVNADVGETEEEDSGNDARLDELERNLTE